MNYLQLTTSDFRLPTYSLYISLSFNLLFFLLALLFLARKGGVFYLRMKILNLGSNRDRSSIQVASPSYYLQRFSQFKLLPKSSSDIIFLGDSITDECEWSELLGNPYIKNRGISGDTTMGILNRLEDIIDFQPAKIFIMVGINNLIHYQQSPSEIFTNYQKIVTKSRDRSPKTEIFIQSVLPINRAKSNLNVSDRDIVQLNSYLQELATEYSLTYIDLFSYLSNEQYQLSEYYTLDGVHLNGHAYSIWKQVIEKYI